MLTALRHPVNCEKFLLSDSCRGTPCRFVPEILGNTGAEALHLNARFQLEFELLGWLEFGPSGGHDFSRAVCRPQQDGL